MNRAAHLQGIAHRSGALVVYLFGSRAADGQLLLDGEAVEAAGSDLDVGVLLERVPDDPLEYGALQADLDELFAPLRVDLVLLHEADAFLQEAAVRGREVYCADEHRRDEYELEVLRRVADLLPIQRALERELYGFSNR